MFRSYLTIAWRNLLRNKVFSFINITGLAIGLAVGFLIYQYVLVELSYDRFHEKADRIYRVPIDYNGGFSLRASAINHPAVGPAMKADFPEVEDFARLVRASLFIPAATVSHEKAGEEIIFNEEGLYFADQSFLTMFTFPLLEGDARTALKEPLSIVVTKSTARKYFGDRPALGKILNINRHDCKVTGVMKDVPANSHLQFDMLVSLNTIGENFGYDAWTWPEFYNYILLTPGANADNLRQKLPAFAEKYLGKIWEQYKFHSEMSLQPLTDIHLKSDLKFEQSINGSERTVYFLTLLAVFVLVIAWINYVNLSTAKSLERSKEVGLRKVSGASKKQLITQFFFDAVLVNVIAISLAALILVVTLPFFDTLTGKNISGILQDSGVWMRLSFWGLIAGALLLGVIVVGVYPALLLASFNPAVVLKGKFYKSSSGIALRKGLVVFQYVLSIVLIAGTITISRQLGFMQEHDLGFEKDQLLVVRSAAIFDSTYSRQIQYFENELLQLPGVARMARSNEVPGSAIEDRNSVRQSHMDEEDKVGAFEVAIDDEFLSTYKMDLVSGRNFAESDRFFVRPRGEAPKPGVRPNPVLINEDLATKLGFLKADDAVNRPLKLRLGEEYDVEIIGVVKNHHHVSMKEQVEPIVYYYPEYDYWRYFSIRLSTASYQQVIEDIRKLYSNAFPDNAFQYSFVDDRINNQYQNELQFQKIFGVFTLLAIIIACLGLLGLGVFAVTQRTKEVGIRKVLGASAVRILYLFTRDSIRLVLVSYLIAVPLVYWAMREWLSTFAFHIGIEWQVFLIPPMLLVTVSMVTIVVVSLRAALLNPAVALRHE
jgi:putative ABC transport system permease protein